MQLTRRLAKNSSLVSAITFMGHLLSTGLKLLISRSYGVVGFGRFALIMALARFFSTVVQMGFNQSIVHFISKYHANQDWANARRFFQTGIIHILKVSGLFLIIILLFRVPILGLMNLADSGSVALLIVWSISSIIAVNNYLSATMRSTKRFKEQAILFTSSFPILMLLAYFGLRFALAQTPDLFKFLIIGISMNVVMLILVYVYVRGIFRKENLTSQAIQDPKQLSRYSMPIWLSSTLQSASRSSDRIMLGIFSTLTEVGIYGAGLTFSILVAFPLKSMGPVFQPFIIEAYEKGNFQQINKLYNTMVRWSSLFVIPLLSVLIIFGDRLLLLFGKGFGEAYWVMIILATTQSISTISGIAGTILNMTEKQKSHAQIMTFIFVLTIALNLLLIPLWGALGAALGTGLSIVIVNLIRVRKLIQYYSLKTDFRVVLRLLLSFSPLVILSFWISRLDLIPWYALMSAHIVLSGLIVYFTLNQNEREQLQSKLKRLL